MSSDCDYLREKGFPLDGNIPNEFWGREVEKELVFHTFEEAKKWSMENDGKAFTRNPNNNGFIPKKNKMVNVKSCQEQKAENTRGRPIATESAARDEMEDLLKIPDFLKKPGTKMRITEGIEFPKKCPSCEGNSIAMILYGLPYFESIKPELESGKVSLGGCTISSNSPKWHCNECKAEWGATPWE